MALQAVGVRIEQTLEVAIGEKATERAVTGDEAGFDFPTISSAASRLPV